MDDGYVGTIAVRIALPIAPTQIVGRDRSLRYTNEYLNPIYRLVVIPAKAGMTKKARIFR